MTLETTQVVQHSAPYTEGVTVHVQVVRMGSSLVAWLGASDNQSEAGMEPRGRIDSLALAMHSKFNTVASTLLSKGVDDPSEVIAKRIASKTKMNVFVTCDLSTNDSDLQVFAERTLMQTIKQLLQ
ncbi:hypothetical protein BJ741DRAFT_589424 [Chytriomyces cf. hyalinus JEL632]|nr:hypothetical protein BJ741DRAFT_589424 [Chytriomyces cf. hyalinus JEL632]